MRDVLQDISTKMPGLPVALTQVDQWKAQGYTVVFTNGVFDLVHPGHITYLAKASALGDKLIIGLNSDASVKRLKGENRPINTESARALLLAAMSFTSTIVIFGQDTPETLIRAIKPDVLVKGADYEIKNIAGADYVLSYGGKVKTIELVQGHSSTGIIARIKDAKA